VIEQVGKSCSSSDLGQGMSRACLVLHQAAGGQLLSVYFKLPLFGEVGSVLGLHVSEL
jgi:hypothetical protein